MAKRTMDRALEQEQDNRREIGSLKDVLAQLNTTVAINTEATRGLKEVVEKEFNRHAEDRKGLDSRVTVVETRVDAVELNLASNSSASDRLQKVESMAGALERRMDTRDGWSAGVKWAIGITLAVSLPCAGYVLVAVVHKIFGM